MASITSANQRLDSGLAAGLAAYTLWGFLPLLFELLTHVGAATVVADRTIWSLLLVSIILVLGGRTAEVRAILRDWAAVRSMAIAAFVLAASVFAFLFFSFRPARDVEEVAWASGRSSLSVVALVKTMSREA